jgi:hypothetical protein
MTLLIAFKSWRNLPHREASFLWGCQMSTVVRREIRKRGFFGKLFKFLFIAFNVLMLIWMIAYWVQVGHMITDATSEAVKTGAAVGTTLGTTFILFFWAAGSLVLGLLTMLSRGAKIIIEETTQ